ncbi:uncharacterized protein LOC121711587 isoform X4 [Alosa sapidissima]|uniref:uncharacterized protein LOC121711587 isoform X3 n=1 Tax=Alosa sapidissima TaxID=34773 RepID=UPI001C09D0A2|nr:uncharacterized protein LOC121711587 isoform X3 [Alosa sapidissima]XP_041951225.1 uncharacterized protein LOC121711587 isoform X4 [Alosa sapidissima]
MSNPATAIQRSSSSIPLPADHVLNSGAVIFPGAFDQQGCPLVVFPTEAQNKLSDLTKEDINGFISYFLRLHNESQEKESLVSVVVDLRQATLPTTRCIAESLQLLELHKRTIHTLYVVQPKKKDVLKLLLKVLVPGNSKRYISAPFKRIFLKEVFELYNYIDRSQLTPSLGGYLIYSHGSWVTFIKEIDVFVKEFLLVVQKLPSCIATLQTISQQPVPSGLDELKEFCSVNEARFQQLRRDLGLDELLRHCECVVEKLRYPENDPCYQAMAGTAIFTHTAYDMLLNYSRITAAVEKVELLWQQAFSKAHLQLRVLQLQREAQQITEQMGVLRKEKLQPYRIEIAKDASWADSLKLDFETCIYTPAMALVRRAEDVIHTLHEMLAHGEVLVREPWVDELEILKERFYSTVQLPYQTLRLVSDFYHYYDKAKSWYDLVLRENFLQDFLWGGTCEGFSSLRRTRTHEPVGGVPVWRRVVYEFLRKNPSPEMAALVQLAHLANVVPETTLQQSGKQLSHRCMTLRKLLSSPGAVPLNDLQLALQWQYEFLRESQNQNTPVTYQTDNKGSDKILRLDSPGGACSLSPEPAFVSGLPSEPTPTNAGTLDQLNKWESGKVVVHHQSSLLPPNTGAVCASVSGKPPSLSSFDSGFDGAGSSHLETGQGREVLDGLLRLPGAPDLRLKPPQPQIHEENISSVSDSEDPHNEFVVAGSPTAASIQIIPKITLDSLNFEIKVKRSATPPKNPWLSLPVEDLENSYTVTITPNRHSRLGDPRSPNGSERSLHSDTSSRSRDQPTQTEVLTSGRRPTDAESREHSVQDSFDSSELSPVRGVLSSTITEPSDQPSFTTEGIPTLMWDSYDFHNLRQEHCDGSSNSLSEDSLNDWDLREQEGLQEVEEILDRAAGILEEEENVLAQEEVLDVLVKTEGSHKQWALWNSEEQFSAMSSCELAESGVIGLDNDLAALPFEQDRSPHGSESKMRALPLQLDDCQRLIDSDLEGAESSQTVLHQELQGLQDLEERILEEHIKIHELRRHEKEVLVLQAENPEDGVQAHRSSTDRERFLKELEKERREVERMEQSLHREMEKDKHKVKKRLSRTWRVVTCSVMERASKQDNLDDVLCEKTKSNSNGPNLEKLTGPVVVVDGLNSKESLISAQSHPQNSFPNDTLETCKNRADTVEVDKTKLSEGNNVDSSNCFEHADGSAPESLADVPGGEPHLEGDSSGESVKEHDSKLSDFTVVEYSEFRDSTVEGKDSGLSDFTVVGEDSEFRDSTAVGKYSELGDSRENVVDEVEGGESEVSLVPDSPPDLGAFEPCVPTERAPVPKPRKTLCVNSSDLSKSEEQINANTYEEDPSSLPSEPTLTTTPPQPKARTCQLSTNHLIPPDVMKHSSNNNNNNPTSEDQITKSCSNTESSYREVQVNPLNALVLDLEGHSTEHIEDVGNVPEPSSEHIEDVGNVPEPSSEHIEDVGNVPEPSSEHIEDVGNVPEPSSEHIEDVGNVPEPSSEHIEDVGNVPEPSSEHIEDVGNVPEPSSEHIEDVGNVPEPSSEHIEDVGNVPEPSSEHIEDAKPSCDLVDVPNDRGSNGFQSYSLSVCPINSSPVGQLIDIHAIEMSLFKTPIVLDTGSGLMKAGFADQSLPTTIFPTVIGVPKYEEVMNGHFERETYIGHDAQHMRGVLALRYPMKNGIIRNWDDMEMIWSHTFQQLGVEPEDHPVMLTEAPLNPKENRQRMVELMFEAFGVPLSYVAMQAVLALYAAGRTTGVVLDSGDGVSHSVPVFEGYCLPHAVQRFTLAGMDVTLHLKKLLQEQGVSMCTSAEQEIVRDMKERHCCVSLNYSAELAHGGASSSPAYYTLPDGQVVCLTTERFRAPEILFKPELIGRDQYGMHESIFKSIIHSDIDLRRSFVGNIVLSGGNTLLAGLPERLQDELKNMVPPDLAECVRVTSPKDRDFSVWSGGAVLANLPAFSSAWISQDEYEEFGPQIVFRKCF